MSVPYRYDRKNLELRQLGAELGMLSEASGSARFSQGNTMVMAAIYGPGQPKYLRHEDYEGLTIDVSCSLSLGGGTGGGGGDPTAVLNEGSNNIQATTEQQCAERQITKIVRANLLDCIDISLFPRQLLSIKLTVLEDDGGVLVACVNAVSLALLNASIPMLYVPVAACVALIQEESEVAEGDGLLLDPTRMELAHTSSQHSWCCRMESRGNQEQEKSSLLGGTSIGTFSTRQHSNAVAVCIEAGGQVHKFMRSALEGAGTSPVV